MAFLCTKGLFRYRRRKRRLGNPSPAAIQQDSVQAKAEFEPTRMIVVKDFSPCVEDELEVQRGQIVKALYQENEWRYVVAENGEEGFIPYIYCIPVTEPNGKRQKNGESFHMQNSASLQTPETSSESASQRTLNSESFQRNHGEYRVLFDFNAVQDEDIKVKQGDAVTVLNKDNGKWLWIKTQHGHEGYIPSDYVQSKPLRNELEVQRNCDHLFTLPAFLGEDDSGIKQLNAIRNFIARDQYELTIHEGEQLYTDDKNLDKLTWVWAFSARTRQRGFVPQTHVRWAQNATFL